MVPVTVGTGTETVGQGIGTVVGPDCAAPSLLTGKAEGAEPANATEPKMLTIATAAVPATTLVLIVIS